MYHRAELGQLVSANSVSDIVAATSGRLSTEKRNETLVSEETRILERNENPSFSFSV